MPSIFICRAGPSRFALGGAAAIDFETQEA
jgi:hypothetical protein